MTYEEIKARHEEQSGATYWGRHEVIHADRAWLLAEVERLRARLAEAEKVISACAYYFGVWDSTMDSNEVVNYMEEARELTRRWREGKP